MRRFIAFALLACVLLCACGAKDSAPTQTPTSPTGESTPVTQPVTEPVTQPATEPVTQPATEPATQPQVEKVTVYLLEKVAYYDSGYADYFYDENYNISSYKSYTIENSLRSEVFFEDKNADGMACTIRTQWAGDMEGDRLQLTYFEDGKLKEEQVAGSNYTGYQYAYDQAGNRTEKREYYDGLLQSATYYTYDGETLTSVNCEDAEGTKLFTCQVENGRIVKQTFLDSGSEDSYLYHYDANGLMVRSQYLIDGEEIPCEERSYKAVEVDADRANYLLQQQRYLSILP